MHLKGFAQRVDSWDDSCCVWWQTGHDHWILRSFCKSVFRFFLSTPVDGKTTGEGIEYIYPSVILAGCLMFLFGLMRLGERTMNILGSSVMIGFCCGLAITICKSQFKFYQVRFINIYFFFIPSA